MSRIVRKNNENRKIARIGVLHVGEKVEKKNKKGELVEIPQSLDYFKASGDYADMFHKSYGEKPNKIEIVFMSDNFDDNINERYELRQGKKIFAYSVNEKLFAWNSEESEFKEVGTTDDKEMMDRLSKKINTEWQEVMTLNFLVLGMKGVFGFWSITTKGKESSMKNILAAYDMVEGVAGRVHGIPFDLRVEKVVSQKPGSKSAFPVISLVANMGDENLRKINDFVSAGVELTGIVDENKVENLQIESQVNHFALIDLCQNTKDVEDLVESIKKQGLENEKELIEFAKQKFKEVYNGK